MAITDEIQGHRWASAFAKQSGAGSPAATAEYQVPAAAGALVPMESRTDYAAADGNAYRPGQYKDKAWAEAKIDFFGFPDSIGRLLTAHLGSDSITGAGDPYTHTIITNNTPQWLTFWTQRPLTGAGVEWDRFDDCTIKAMEFQYVAGQLCHLSCDVLGRVATVAVATPTITVTNKLDSVGPWYTWAAPTLKLDLDVTPAVTAFTNVESMVIHVGYDNMVYDQTVNLNPDFRDPGIWDINFSATLILADWAAYKATFFGSKTASNVAQSATVVSGSADFLINVGPASNANRTLDITLPAQEFAVTAPQPDISGKGLRVTVNGSLEKPPAVAPVTCVLKNAVSIAYKLPKAAEPFMTQCHRRPVNWGRETLS